MIKHYRHLYIFYFHLGKIITKLINQKKFYQVIMPFKIKFTLAISLNDSKKKIYKIFKSKIFLT